MQGYCAKCGRTFDGQMLCPRCGIQLTDDGSGTSTVPMSVSVADDTPDGPPFARRMALGVITLVGLFHGFKHLMWVVALSGGGAGALSPDGLLVLLLAATLAASVTAGTVNRRAELGGFLLGLAAGLGFVGLDLAQGLQPPEEWLIGVPTLLAVAGAIGGLAGRLMIPPAPTLPKFGQTDTRVLDNVKLPGPKLTWSRILAGAVVVVAGTLLAEAGRKGVTAAVVGHGGTFASNQLITWQLGLLVALGGGVLAGANTRIGLRQGLICGLLAGAGAVTAVAARAAEQEVVQFWRDQLDQPDVGPPVFAALGITVGIATALGGWLGGHILPPARR